MTGFQFFLDEHIAFLLFLVSTTSCFFRLEHELRSCSGATKKVLT